MGLEKNNFYNEDEFVDDEIELEKQCDAFFVAKIKSKGPTKYNAKRLSKDLEIKRKKQEQEPLVRQWCSYFLRGIRIEAKNGYALKTEQEKEQTITKKVKEIADFFGVENIYFSKKRKTRYRTKTKKPKKLKGKLPLRKEITEQIYHVYSNIK